MAKPAKKPKRRCKGTTVKGKPCGAVPLRKGTVIEGVTVTGKWCRQHDKDLPDKARIGGAQPGAGRPRKPRVVDVMRERVEEEIEAVLAPYFDTLKNAVLHAKHHGIVYPSDLPDLGARIEAAEKLLDRVYGKPVQVSEIGSGDKPLRISHELLSDADIREGLRNVARRVADARSGKPGGPGPSD